jgi:hypothetical protein
VTEPVVDNSLLYLSVNGFMGDYIHLFRKASY